MSEKTKGQIMKEELFYKKKSAFELKTQEELQAAKDYAVGYAKYLDEGKTEREEVAVTVEMAKAKRSELSASLLLRMLL